MVFTQPPIGEGVKMKFTELLSRINGFSVPLFGVSWEPAKADIVIAKSVILFLEDRRVLYVPYMAEEPDRVIQSVLSIRAFLTQTLVQGQMGKELEGNLRGMRAACRKFLDEHPHDQRHVHYRDIELNQSLGEFRGVIGQYVAMLSVSYGINIDKPLDAVLPAADEDDAE